MSTAANQYIVMISEGSYDTEDWSNDAGKNYSIFDQINVAQKSNFFQKHIKQKYCWPQCFEFG